MFGIRDTRRRSLRPTADRRAHQPAVGTSCIIIDPVIDFFKISRGRDRASPPAPWFPHSAALHCAHAHIRVSSGVGAKGWDCEVGSQSGVEVWGGGVQDVRGVGGDDVGAWGGGVMWVGELPG